jgi:cytochrome c oxidase subunit 3
MIMSKPWEHAGEMDGIHGEYTFANPAAKTGLMVLLGVMSSMFLLFMISYWTRMQSADWEVMRDPPILWFNTLILVLASVVLQLASNRAKKEPRTGVQNLMIAGGLLTIVFIAGQLVAWEQMIKAGHYAVTNPANAFFYMFTGIHALHLLGGFWFLARLGFRSEEERKSEQAARSIALCATYWHYLLLVWVALFTLLLRT